MTPISPASPIGEGRDRLAEERDARAEASDEASEVRDEKAEARDDRAEARERSSASDVEAAADRAGALHDRHRSAVDRLEAAGDRAAAAADRRISATERTVSSIDELTGAYRRDIGTLALEREIVKAKRTDRPLVVAFVDIDDLKVMNDSLGHAAGDRLLRRTVGAMRRHLRSYDLIVRFGGDEFVCCLAELTMPLVEQRFDDVNAELSAGNQGSITVGLAEMGPEDTLERLIARADEALYAQRNQAL